MSATGSVSISSLSVTCERSDASNSHPWKLRSIFHGLPTRLRHAGDGSLVRQLAEADAAEAEALVDGPGPSAAVAACVLARLKLLWPRGLRDQAFLSHAVGPPS